MKKSLLILFFCLFICGCKKDKDIICKNKVVEDNFENSVEITLKSKDDTVLEEELLSVYIFKNHESAEKNYEVISKQLEKDETIKVETKGNKIIASGKKDVTDMNYDKKSKIAYYEKLGYTCR